MKSEYFIVLFCVLFFPLVLSFDRNLGIYRRRGALLRSMAIVCPLFWAWDVVAAARGHWSFNAEYTVGLVILGLPIEEWLFFIVASFVSIFTWESTKYFLRKRD
jgi:lycopene cyclase domain-containing protein